MKLSKAVVLTAMYLIAPWVFVIMWIASAVTDGAWIFGKQTLSTLGVSSKSVSSFLFNAACIITGAAISASGALLYKIRNDKKWLAAIIVLDGLFLLLVGIFTKAPETHTIHVTVASTFGIITSLLIMHTAGIRVMRKQYLFPTIIVIMAIIVTVIGLTQEFPLTEAIGVIIAMIWFEMMGVENMILNKRDPSTEHVPF